VADPQEGAMSDEARRLVEKIFQGAVHCGLGTHIHETRSSVEALLERALREYGERRDKEWLYALEGGTGSTASPDVIAAVQHARLQNEGCAEARALSRVWYCEHGHRNIYLPEDEQIEPRELQACLTCVVGERVREEEREACAKVAEEPMLGHTTIVSVLIASAIRARGKGESA
jgi:hypothetical protein